MPVLYELTKATAEKLGLHVAKPDVERLDPFYTWVVDRFTLDGKVGYLLMNVATRFPVVLRNISPRKKTDPSPLFEKAIRGALLAYGFADSLVDHYLKEGGEIEFSATHDRKITAAMNQMKNAIPYCRNRQPDETVVDDVDRGIGRILVDYNDHAPTWTDSPTAMFARMTELLEESGLALPSPVSYKAYQFKVTLQGVEPPVWRRILVPAWYDFNELHGTLQQAFSWQQKHLYEFALGDSPSTRLSNDLDEEGGNFLPPDVKPAILSTGAKLEPFEALLGDFLYRYDFGDDWEHLVELERVIENCTEFDPPHCLDGEQKCPPEDCGGIGGYEDLLRILSDPADPEYEEMKEWVTYFWLMPFRLDIIKQNIKRIY